MRNKVLQLVHLIRTSKNYPDAVKALAWEALKQHDEAKQRIAQLERQLKAEKRAQLYGMTDLA